MIFESVLMLFTQNYQNQSMLVLNTTVTAFSIDQQFNCSSCVEQFANGSAVFWVTGHFSTPPEN